jgi:hypothetical protein
MRHLPQPFLVVPFGLTLLLAAATLPRRAPGQDAIGVTFQGAVLRLDTTTGAVSLLANGTPGKNCLTFTNDGRLWTVIRPDPLLSVWRLAVIDPFTGAESLPFPALNVGDLRAMCIGRFVGGLYAIRDASPNDQLIHIDTDTGAVNVIGATNHYAIQGMEDPFGGPKAWDVNAGMIQIFFDTGFTNDPFLSVVDPAGLQFMCRHPVTNERYVGRGSLYRLTTGTGVTTFVTAFAGNPDLRGMEFTAARDERFGAPCPASALFIDMEEFSAPGTMRVTSSNHQPGIVGAQIVGFSEDLFGSIPLPMALDPLLGTSGNCQLHVSADFLVIGVADTFGQLVVDLPVPAAARFLQFYVQHLGLENVPGGFTFTGGLRVRSAL